MLRTVRLQGRESGRRERESLLCSGRDRAVDVETSMSHDTLWNITEPSSAAVGAFAGIGDLLIGKVLAELAIR